MKNKNRIYKDEIGTTYAFVKTYYSDRAICITSNSPGFDLIKYTIVDEYEDIISATRIKHYNTLDEALSDSDYTPTNLAVDICYRCKECDAFETKRIHITSAKILKDLLEAPYTFLNDVECDVCNSNKVRIFEVLAVTEYDEKHIDDDVFCV